MSVVTFVEQTVDPGTPAAGRVTVFAKADVLFIIDEFGVVTDLTAAGSEFADNIFRITDDGDASKKIAFQASGITTATTRTITMPDADVLLGAGGDTTAIHKNVAAEISAITTEKTLLLPADWFVIESAADANAKRKLKAENIPGAPLTFSDYTIGTTTTVRYLNPFSRDSGDAHATEEQYEIPRAGTIRNMFVLCGTAGVGAATITYTMRVEGADSILVVVMSNTATEGSDTTNAVVVAKGDKISISAAKSTSITTSQRHIRIAMEFAA